jgi:Ca2+/H+ antiporter, TMEM165/GDT1 family
VVLVLAVFGASLVESVEALTIVLAAGTARGWRSALEGCASAVVVLGALIAGFGIPIVRYVPLAGLRVVVGGVLLVMGMGWLRKAWLRSSGLKAKHDEDAIFARTLDELSRAPQARSARDPVAFAMAFKGTFLEGTEVALIVISLGASAHRLGLAAIAAGAAVVLVAVVGVVVARQLSQVPENLIKAVVGVMLCSFGLFWVGEGSGLQWPGSDGALLVLIALFAVATAVAPRWLRPRSEP